jgi:hypothetical protein
MSALKVEVCAGARRGTIVAQMVEARGCGRYRRALCRAPAIRYPAPSALLLSP